MTPWLVFVIIGEVPMAVPRGLQFSFSNNELRCLTRQSTPFDIKREILGLSNPFRRPLQAAMQLLGGCSGD